MRVMMSPTMLRHMVISSRRPPAYHDLGARRRPQNFLYATFLQRADLPSRALRSRLLCGDA